MKYLLALALLASMPSLAQQPARLPFPGANELIVQVADSGAVTWERAAQLLVAQGYRLRVRDRTRLRLETEPRLLKPRLRSTVQVIVLGHYVRVSGQVALFPDLLQYTPFPIEFPSPRDRPSMMTEGWAELVGIAKALHGPVFYLDLSQVMPPH